MVKHSAAVCNNCLSSKIVLLLVSIGNTSSCYSSNTAVFSASTIVMVFCTIIVLIDPADICITKVCASSNVHPANT